MYIFSPSNDRFSACQFGFRNNRTCVHAICEVTGYKREKIDDRLHGKACFIDLMRVFDTTDHKIVSQKEEISGSRSKKFLIRN